VLKAAVEGRLTQQWRAEHPDVEPADQLLQRILRERREKWEQDQLAKYEAKGKKPPKNWKDKYKEPAAPDTTNLPKLPARWCWATVDQLAAVQSGQTPTGIKSRLVPNGALDWFKVGDMNETSNSWYMTAAKARLSSEDADSLGLHRAPAGTIIFPKRGGAIATNKKRILAFESSYDLNTMGVTPHSAVANYFFWWFATVDFRKISDGSNVPQINHDDIAPLMFPLPPAEEQTAIVSAVERAVSSANSLLISNRGNRFRASKLRQAILQWAFEGKLINANP
jgi:type I restriction enzyme S subunit